MPVTESACLSQRNTTLPARFSGTLRLPLIYTFQAETPVSDFGKPLITIRRNKTLLTRLTRNISLLFLTFTLTVAARATEDPWAEVIEQVSDSVVSLQVSQLRDFDLSDQGLGGATGFVVDAERGIILTNRHVIGSGPVRATATFQNKERIDLLPLYRDPIHDFGFFRYDPSTLRHINPVSLDLHPEKVRVGMDIRVIGSDGGEQLSILAGTVARIDRKAPNYGRYEYNDFNTFYFQAASSTSGGSSGSPVLDAAGDVIALNAAANSRTAASFFLPLDRVKRALTLIQAGEPVTRGSLQSLFSHRSFRDLRTLGLGEDTENAFRAADATVTGLLAVTQVFPGGVAENRLKEGDILLSLNSQAVTGFVRLEDMLDSHVGSTIALSVLRQSQQVDIEIQVADLHAGVPTRFLQLGDSILQEMSLQHIRGMNIRKQGVVVADPGYMFQEAGISRHAVITHINKQEVNGLDDVVSLLSTDNLTGTLQVRFIEQRREKFSQLTQIDLHTRWFDYRSCERRDDERFWHCEALEKPAVDVAPRVVDATLPDFQNPLLQKLAPAMVKVDFNIPYRVDNAYARHFSGTGLVVDAEKGLIVIDRNTVPISMGETSVTFFGAFRLPAEVVFLHPDHNLAMLQYDPQMLGDIRIPEPVFAGDDVSMPAKLFRLSFRQDGTYQFNALGNLSRVSVALDAPGLPRFQQQPVDVYSAANMPPSLGGPVIDETGVIHAIWTSFAYQDGKEIAEAEWAIPIRLVREMLDNFNDNPGYYSLGVRLHYRSLATARELGLSDEWMQRFARLEATSRRVLYIEQVVPGSSADDKLRPGDILLTIDGTLVTDLLQAQSLGQKPAVKLELLRNGTLQTVEHKPDLLPGRGTDRVISWAGALFQEPHREISLYKGISTPGVYITRTESGSPAIWDHLYRNRLVTEINGQPVTGLDDFLQLVRNIRQDEYARLTTVSMTGRRDIIGVSPEYYFWPTFEIRREENGWQRIDYPEHQG